MPAKPTIKPLTLEITRGSCKVQVRGKRSMKGWNIDLIGGAVCERQGFRKAKEDAIQFALDSCEPGVTGAIFRVQPAD